MQTKSVNIVLLDALTLGEIENVHELKKLGVFTSYDSTSKEERIERLQNCQIVITNKVIIDREVMDACPDLELICISATGMNNVDLSYARKKGIEVKNVAGYSTESVAQSTFSMLLFVMHQSAYYNRYVKSGEYAKSPIFTHHKGVFRELKGKQFGIVGLGSIGKRVAEIATVFGANVVYYSTSGKNINAGYPNVPLDKLMATSDVISIHCPLNNRTQNLIDAAQLKTAKPSAYIINMGRGGIINEQALADALNNDWISGAATDVLTEEPVNENNPLLKIHNPDKIFIAPHIAWASAESRKLLIEKIIENIENYIASK